MGDGNSIRAKRRARGKDKAWWIKGPKIKNHTLHILSLEQEEPSIFIDFEKVMKEKLYSAIGCNSEMFKQGNNMIKQSYLNDVLRFYLAEKGLVFNGNN